MMRFVLLGLSLFGFLAAADPDHVKRQTTDSAQLSSAIGQLISLYVPASAVSAIGSAASAASVSGSDVYGIVQSVLTATTTPSWYSALPTQYSSNLESLDAAISSLYGFASTGTLDAPRVFTTTNSEGSTYLTTTSDTYTATSTVVATVTTGSSSGSSSTDISSIASALSSVKSAASSIASSQDSSLASALSSATGASSSSSGFAIPTAIPAAAAGVLGLVGLVALL